MNSTSAPRPDGTEFCAYRLPDGRIVDVDASAAKDARIIGFTLADGTVVDAIQAGRNHVGYRTYGTTSGATMQRLADATTEFGRGYFKVRS